jgi:hypothetical protein
MIVEMTDDIAKQLTYVARGRTRHWRFVINNEESKRHDH